MPEASIPSRFLEEVPAELLEDLAASQRGRMDGRLGSGGRPARIARATRSYATIAPTTPTKTKTRAPPGQRERSRARPSRPTPASAYNSIDNIAEFFASRGKKFSLPKPPVEEPTGKQGFRPGQRVRHPKYGEGTVYQREGEGEDAKITVQFPRFGLKKLVEKYAQLEESLGQIENIGKLSN